MNLTQSPSYTLQISPDITSVSQLAAKEAADVIRACIARKGGARIMVGTGNAQLEMVGFLTGIPLIDWSRVECFHLDEYVGISRDHPASFRRWIRRNFEEKVRPKVVHYLEGDATNLRPEIQNYTNLLLAAPVDLAFVGIGENGHIAFNDPHTADFNDPEIVKRVTLDEACCRQQVGEGHFSGMDTVPREALTVSCRGLFRAEKWVCCVPDRRKAAAVQASLEGPVSAACPGSLVQRHPNVSIFLDTESASLLSLEKRR